MTSPANQSYRISVADESPTGGASSARESVELNGGSCCKWGCSSEKALKIFASIFCISLVAITVTALIVNFPQTSTAFYSVFGTAAFVSLIGFVIAAYRHWKDGENGEILAMTAQRAMQVFAIVFAVSAAAVTFNGLITHFPHASTAMYSVLSIAAAASFITSLVIITRKCLGNKEDVTSPKSPPKAGANYGGPDAKTPKVSQTPFQTPAPQTKTLAPSSAKSLSPYDTRSNAPASPNPNPFDPPPST